MLKRFPEYISNCSAIKTTRAHFLSIEWSERLLHFELVEAPSEQGLGRYHQRKRGRINPFQREHTAVVTLDKPNEMMAN